MKCGWPFLMRSRAVQLHLFKPRSLFLCIYLDFVQESQKTATVNNLAVVEGESLEYFVEIIGDFVKGDSFLRFPLTLR